MKREQFTFYRSFWDALRALPKKEQLPFVMALCAYALDEEETSLSGASAASFCLVKPVLDKARRKAESGRIGGNKPKANRKQKQANKKQNGICFSEYESQKEVEEEVEVEREKETEIDIVYDDDNDPPTPQEIESVIVVFRKQLDQPLSQRSVEELGHYAEQMGTECCLRALEVAEDAGKLNWGYVRGILRIKAEQGVHSLEDWDRLERQREVGKQSIGGTPKNVQPSEERIQKSSDWLDEFLDSLEKGVT